MADEVGTGELARRLDEIRGILQGLVGRPEYTEYQRLIEHRFTEQERDLAAERDERKADLAAERDARKTAIADERKAREAGDEATNKRLDQAGTNWKQVLYQGLLPGMAILITAANLWITSRGGG